MSPGCGRDLQRAAADDQRLVAADALPGARRASVPSNSSTMPVAAAAAPTPSGSNRIQSKRATGTLGARSDSAAGPICGSANVASGAGRPTGRNVVAVVASRTRVQVRAVGDDPHVVRRAARRRDAAELVGALVARVAVGLVDELEVAVAARGDHVHRRPVVVVRLHAQAGLLVVLGRARSAEILAVAVHVAVGQRLDDEVLRATCRPPYIEPLAIGRFRLPPETLERIRVRRAAGPSSGSGRARRRRTRPSGPGPSGTRRAAA